MVAVLEIDALYVVCVHVRRGINTSKREVSVNRFVFLNLDLGCDETSRIGGCLSFLTGLRIDVGSVLLALQLGKRQTLAFRVNNNPKSVRYRIIPHVNGVLTGRQTVLRQSLRHHLVPVALLINQVDVTTCDLFRVARVLVVQVLIAEQAEVNLSVRLRCWLNRRVFGRLWSWLRRRLFSRIIRWFRRRLLGWVFRRFWRWFLYRRRRHHEFEATKVVAHL